MKPEPASVIRMRGVSPASSAARRISRTRSASRVAIDSHWPSSPRSIHSPAASIAPANHAKRDSIAQRSGARPAGIVFGS
jgi:hypothetical protein